MLKQRLLVALVFLPLFVWLIFLPAPWPLFGFFLAGLGVITLELGQMIRQRGFPFHTAVVLSAVLLLGVIAGFGDLAPAGGVWQVPVLAWAVLFVTFLVLTLWEVYTGRPENSFVTVTLGVFTVLLLGGVGGCIFLLRRLPQGSWWVFMLFGFNWLYDGGAMLGGKAFGRTRLAPAVSPHKTVEGVLTGLAANAAAGWVVFALLLPRALGFSAWQFIALAVGLGVLAQVGDLAESLIKRWAGCKNSSEWIPGHGGALDKFDSAIFTAPLLYAFALWWLR